MVSQFYIKSDSGSTECQLCPHFCKIKNERVGICNTRLNRNGVLESTQWGVISSSSLDPIEKKPLYHFFPGKMIYSIGGFGCNLKCSFCQNYEISQYVPQNIDNLRIVLPQEVVMKAKIHPNNIGIAYTYNEPTISYEYMLEVARIAKLDGLKNVMVSNGYINKEPLSVLFEFIDAFNIDLKAFTDIFYRKYTGGRLQPVLDSLKEIRKSGKHLEITFLVIPNLNDNMDDAKSMIDWIANELGEHTILHLSRYHPAHLVYNPLTPIETLTHVFNIAKQKLQFVYIGNVPNLEVENNTNCPKCGNVLINRDGFYSSLVGLNADGSCKECDLSVVTMA
ncbi:MAG: AmmeMemoRadiSam system radical SAM enzyme [Bacteroidales bacterium]|nr:AmmeMemoRadiSam system radical SAM enzyme [Bacteroidales bacterium]